MKTINCVVRLENDNPIMFWYEVYSRDYYPRGQIKPVKEHWAVLSCFNHAEGHNEACHEYMRSLKPCPSELASEFVARYNYNHCDDGQPSMKLCERLAKPKR